MKQETKTLIGTLVGSQGAEALFFVLDGVLSIEGLTDVITQSDYDDLVDVLEYIQSNPDSLEFQILLAQDIIQQSDYE